MADQQTEVGSEATTDVLSRDAFVAEMESLENGDAATKPDDGKATPVDDKKPAAKPVEADDDDDTDTDDEVDEKPAKAAKPADDEDDEPADPDDDDLEHDADPQIAKRMRAVKKSEERSRAVLAHERGEFERERAQHKDKLDRFERLSAKARFAPAEVLVELGLTDDDWEAAARDVYSRSKQFAADPKNREAATKLQRDREDRERSLNTEREVTKLREELAAEKKAAAADREIGQFMGGVEKSVSADAHPAIAKQLEKAPVKARAGMLKAANELAAELGQLPSAKRILARYEKQRIAELEESGIDVAEYLKTKPNTLVAEKKKPAATLQAPDPAKPPRSAPKSQKERREEFLAASDELG